MTEDENGLLQRFNSFNLYDGLVPSNIIDWNLVHVNLILVFGYPDTYSRLLPISTSQL
jgi:hypothetical protein